MVDGVYSNYSDSMTHFIGPGELWMFVLPSTITLQIVAYCIIHFFFHAILTVCVCVCVCVCIMYESTVYLICLELITYVILL